MPFRRHNNGLESSHRRIRKGIRERTGKSETNREMEQFGVGMFFEHVCKGPSRTKERIPWN